MSAVVAAEDVECGKPAPDGFRLALAQLSSVLTVRQSINPQECLAIEDTRAGVAAAREAGMRVLAVAQAVDRTDLADADGVRPSLAETDLDEVLRLLQEKI